MVTGRAAWRRRRGGALVPTATARGPRHRWRALALPVALVSVLTACGAAEVEGVARDRAVELLTEHVADAMECVTATAPQLDQVSTDADLAAVLARCADTAPPTADWNWMHRERPGHPTVVFSSTRTEPVVVLDMMTVASGAAEAGVANARVYIVTCWRATLDTQAGAATAWAEAACNDALVAAFSQAAEVEPFSELDLA